MARSDSSGGAGCLGMIVVLALLGWVLQHLVQILVFAALTTALGLALWSGAALIGRAAERAEQRARCPVCTGWSGSVLLTDVDESARVALCQSHWQRLTRIEALEQQVKPWADPSAVDG